MYFIWKDGVFFTMESKAHVCSIRFTTEEYGWLVRYSEKNDMSISQVVRRAVKTYRIALASKEKKKKEEG